MLDRLSSATRIDFTEGLPGFINFSGFADDSVQLLRKKHATNTLVVVDYGYELSTHEPHIVKDHINLTGTNPLVGPNPPCGPRFPVVNDIYLSATQTIAPNRTLPLKDPFGPMPTTVVAGPKPETRPQETEMKLIRELGADCYCYNLVPTMLVAAHAGWKVFGVLIPHGYEITSSLAMNLRGVTQ